MTARSLHWHRATSLRPHSCRSPSHHYVRILQRPFSRGCLTTHPVDNQPEGFRTRCTMCILTNYNLSFLYLKGILLCKRRRRMLKYQNYYSYDNSCNGIIFCVNVRHVVQAVPLALCQMSLPHMLYNTCFFFVAKILRLIH